MITVGQKRGRRGLARLSVLAILPVALLATGLAVVRAGQHDGSADEARLELPKSFAKVWYRPEKTRGFGGGRGRGELTLDRTGIRFEGRKRDVVVPLASIHRLSFGKMRGDVDTSWVVLSYDDEEARRRIGFRDGKKLGYGGRSREIYAAIRALLRETGNGQYRAPGGYAVYDGLESEFTIAYPENWHLLHRTLNRVIDRETRGVLVFSPERLSPPPDLPPEEREASLRQALARVDSGLAGAFFVARQRAGRGMRCEGFGEKARARLLDRLAADPLFEGERADEESTRTVPGTVDGCVSLRMIRRSQSRGHAARVLDLVAVVHEETLFLFGLRSREVGYEKDRAVFESALETARFAVAKP